MVVIVVVKVAIVFASYSFFQIYLNLIRFVFEFIKFQEFFSLYLPCPNIHVLWLEMALQMEMALQIEMALQMFQLTRFYKVVLISCKEDWHHST